MAYKLGFLLSLFYLVQIVCYTGDLSILQEMHSILDATSITCAKKIALEGKITNEIITLAREQAQASIKQVSTGIPQVGEVFVFKLYRDYKPLVISDSPMVVSVTRSTVIGYID
jgi:hypothetical protein